jgi:hypothetical protein
MPSVLSRTRRPAQPPSRTIDSNRLKIGIHRSTYRKNMTNLFTIDAVTAWAGAELAEQYLNLLGSHGGSFVSPVIRLYSVDELIERNETYETKKYCPGYLTIGDDSGGQAIVIAIGKSHGPVFIIDHGSMDPDYFTEVAPNLATWIGSGFSVRQ